MNHSRYNKNIYSCLIFLPQIDYIRKNQFSSNVPFVEGLVNSKSHSVLPHLQIKTAHMKQLIR